MAASSETPVPNPEVLPATVEQAPVLANLLELYTYDFSEFLDLEPGPDGRFGYRDLRLYWKDPDRHPFLVRVDGHLAGFVFVHQVGGDKGSEPVWDVAEFFILRRLRRRQIGTLAAHAIWRRFSGRWQVRVMDENQPAVIFWRRAVAAFAGESVEDTLAERNGSLWHIFRFGSRG